jgi:EmrB/QacA subfamily drug resistance transporter
MARTPEGSDTAAVVIDPDVYVRRWWILAILCTSLMLVIIGNTALNLAIPTLSEQLGASTSELQWMVDAYSLVFAGFLFTGGSLGDRFGRKGALQVGLLIFMSGSLLAALSDSSWGVIAGRSVMGFGAAFVMPATLSIITNVFPAHERSRAIAIWAGIAAAGAALGPIASGFLLRHFSWGSVFYLNVPIVIFALVAGWFILPTSRDPEEGKLDPPGALLSILGLGALVYAIIEAPDHGWLSAPTFIAFALAAVLLAGFLTWEMKSSHPMLNLALFQDQRFSVASFGMVLIYFAMFGIFFLLTQYFQLVHGYDPLKAGFAGLPFAVVMMATAPQGPKVAARIGLNRTISLGMGMAAVGLLLFSFVGSSTPYLVFVIPMMVMAGGMALSTPSLTASIMSAVPLGRAGVGSAMNDTTRELGGALGVAVLGSLAVSRYDSLIAGAINQLPPVAHSAANSSLSGALEVAGQLPGREGAALANTARDAYVSGMNTATLVAAIAAAIGSVVVYRMLPAVRSNRVAARTVAADTAEAPAAVTLTPVDAD